jgi:glycerate kinase
MPIPHADKKRLHILIAPNAFKNALPADEVAAALGRGIARSTLEASVEAFPVGDGGDGTGDLLIRRWNADKIAVKARDPLGRPVTTYFGRYDPARVGLSGPTTAIIEMANASGLRLLAATELDPLHALSVGTGDLIRASLDHKVGRIILGIGGSATVDGGTGILRSLGVRFLNVDGQPLRELPADLCELESIDSSGLDPRLAGTEIIVLCDVDSPLTGPEGAAEVFGPQKGAPPQAVRRLEAGLETLARVIKRQTGRDVAGVRRGGAAGGAAAGLYGLVSAQLVSGIDYFLTATAFDAALDGSTHVITGEGAVDRQTLEGKAPFGVAVRAHARGIPVIAFAGKVPEDIDVLKGVFDQIIDINPASMGLAEAIAHTAVNLERAAMEWGNGVAADGIRSR